MRYRRADFSNDTKRQAFARSRGICECHLIPHVFPNGGCGCQLGPGNTFYEHIDPSRISGRNDLDNAACLTRTCWRYKTSNYDRPVIDRVRKREDRHRSIRPAPSLPGNRADPRRKKLNGQVVDRATGEPWGMGR